MKRISKPISAVLACYLLLSNAPGFASQADPSTPETPVQATEQTAEQLQQLVAPIALYPDALVAQILAAATYPDQVVEADRWMQEHPNLKDEELAREVDKQDWDPSVKALTGFASVLANMDKNLSWTSSLGDAYVNQQQDVMDAIQLLRRRAEQAGHLNSNAQQKVTTEGNTIAIEPASTEVVYVPQYNPWLAYGAPLVAWPGWYWYPGLFWDGPGIGFGVGFGLGFFGGFGWGWHHWGADWGHHAIVFNHNTYISHSRTFINRRTFAGREHAFGGPGNGFHAGGVSHRGGDFNGGFRGGRPAGRFHGQPRSGAFGGFAHGGIAHGFGARGRSSFGGGFHGGGSHGGGRR